MRTLITALLLATLATPVPAKGLFAVDLQPGEDARHVAATLDGVRWMGLGTTLVVETTEEALPERLATRSHRIEQAAGTDLALVLSKHAHDAQHAPFPGTELARHSGLALAALAPGAAPPAATDMHVRVRPVPWNTVVVEPLARPQLKATGDPAVDAMVATVSKDAVLADIQKLVDFKSRHTLSQGYKDAAAWTEAQLAAAGLVTRRVPFEIGGRTAENVLGELTGTKPDGDIFVIGAHLDSIAFEGGQAAAPGADDNASGSACVLAIARAFTAQKPAATLRFIFFGGEEEGLLGSTAYVEGLSPAERARHKGALILDMTAFHRGAALGLMLEGRELSAPLTDAVAEAAARYTTLKVERSLEAWGSDHIPFLDAGIPALLTFELDYPVNGNQHSLRDTMQIVDAEQAAAIARADTAALARLTGLSSSTTVARTR